MGNPHLDMHAAPFRWIAVPDQIQAYHLTNGQVTLIRMTSDGLMSNIKTALRQVLIRPVGLWSTQFVIEDSTQQKLGKITATQLEIGGQVHSVSWDNAPMARMTVRAGDDTVILRYGLNAGQNGRTEVAFQVNSRWTQTNEGLLLLAAAWHRFLPVARETVEFAF